MQNYKYVKISPHNQITERQYTEKLKVVIFQGYDDGQFFPSLFPLICIFCYTVSTSSFCNKIGSVVISKQGEEGENFEKQLESFLQVRKSFGYACRVLGEGKGRNGDCG